MNINFGKWQKEVIYDDHGGHYPCRTDYRTVLMIDGVKCTASFSDFSFAVYVYHNNHHFVSIYDDTHIKNTDKAEALIKAEFSKNAELISYAKEKISPRISKLKESLYQKLLDEAGD